MVTAELRILQEENSKVAKEIANRGLKIEKLIKRFVLNKISKR